jgi:dihydroorotate dehydrogenase (NAD+) catalytic subunit
MIDRLRRARIGVPMVGIGGVQSGVDVAEFLLAGASAVQLGTRSFVEPGAGARVVGELSEFLREQRVERAASLIGALE